MPRRNAAKKREIYPDAKFEDIILAKFINYVMKNGEKSKSERIVYQALDKIKTKLGNDPLEFFHEVIDNLKPTVEVKSRRVGGATFQVPDEVRRERRQALAFRWLISAASKRSETTMIDRLTAELLDANQSRGAAYKKKEDTHRMAEANKAFSHYRW